MKQWQEIRHRVLKQGVSKRQILRETGMHWQTLEKILEHSSPPGEKEFQRFIDSKYQRFIIGEYQGQKYMLLYDDKPYVMLSGVGWGLQKVEAVTDSMGNPAVAFEFDETGTVLFGTLTTSNLQKSLAIVIDDKVYSAPAVETKIQGKGRISGRFSEEEVSKSGQGIENRHAGG